MPASLAIKICCGAVPYLASAASMTCWKLRMPHKQASFNGLPGERGVDDLLEAQDASQTGFI